MNETIKIKRPRVVRTAMDLEFANYRHELNEKYNYCDWLTWIGSPMLYDSGLFVTREDK